MEGSFGKVLKKAIGREEEEEQKSRPTKISLFANPTRQNIFQYLCERPCSHLRRISRDLNIAAPTAEWHLKKFIENGILSDVMMENKHYYYPSNIVDPKDVEIVCHLNNEKSRMIYKTIMETPGITQIKICEKLKLTQQVASSHTTHLEKVGLIKSQREGRSKRYNITKHPKDLLQSNQQRRKHFRKWLLRILKEEGLKPKVLRVRDWEMRVQIDHHGKTSVLKINSNPFSGIF